MLYGILGGVIVSMGVGGYFYYTTTQAELTELRDLNTAYNLKFEQQEQALESLQADFQLQTESLSEMQAKSQEIQAEMARYLDIFKRHNLTKLAAAKPGLIETRVNKGTKNVFDSIEADSSTIDGLDDGLQLAPTKDTTGSEDSN
jgi:hypothetical protein